MKNTDWTKDDALRTYNTERWGNGYFRISEEGTITVHPYKTEASIDLLGLVRQLRTRGIEPPVLIRFSDILHHRMREVHEAFGNAISENNFNGSYFCAYPIKVNHQRHLVEEVVRFGRPLGFGLEAGSKPELLAAVALTDTDDTPIICNGFKDEEFLRMVVLGQKVGKNLIPVVEQYHELKVIVQQARELGVRPVIGVRAKLTTQGAGRWKSSAGAGSKFGLTTSEILEAVEFLRENEMLDCLAMLHFHMGSQITNIQNVKSAITEASRIFIELHQLGAGMRYLNVGGGLGVDYDGSQSDFESSMNYTLQEYANDIVYRVMSACDKAKVPHPTIVSESGRALMAYNSVLIFEAFGSLNSKSVSIPSTVDPDAPQQVVDLLDAVNNLTKLNVVETYHDATRAIEDAQSAFNLGYMSLANRALCERLARAFYLKLHDVVRELDYIPEDLQELPGDTNDTVFCNFSVFQSIPDSWAIDQVFPIMPIHRLLERPTEKAILADLTCDSDGKIDHFPALADVKPTLELHPITSEPYYLGAFLLGAYQETLGDLHNLFGDTHAVHVSLDEDGTACIDEVIDGDTVGEVLTYFEYVPDQLLSRVRRDVDRAVRSNRLADEEAKQFLRFYEEGLRGYTYFE